MVKYRIKHKQEPSLEVDVELEVIANNSLYLYINRRTVLRIDNEGNIDTNYDTVFSGKNNAGQVKLYELLRLR